MVITNDAEHRNETLVCSGSVLVPFKTSPGNVDFGQINRSMGPQRKTVKIERGDGGPLDLELLPMRHQNVKANLREVEPGELYELDVELTPPWPNRPLITNLTLKTGVSEAPQETIRINARIVARLRAHPARFSIPREATTEIERKVRLVWSGDNPGKILETKVSDPQMTVAVEEGEGQPVVVLRVPAGYNPPSNSRAVITVKTDDPEVPTLPIDIYVPPPRARVRAMPAWFGVPREVEAETDLRSRLVWSGAPGKILEATTSDPATSVRVEELNNQQYVVLHVPAGYKPTGGRATVTVKTDDPVMPTLSLPVRVGGIISGAQPAGRVGQQLGRPVNRPAKPPAPPPPPKPAP